MTEQDENEGLGHKAEEYGGKAKEAIGKATGDDELARQGRSDQAKSSLKQAGDKLKQAFSRR
jgi:uncharacterized protein YjbJ (UPF0337 family)